MEVEIKRMERRAFLRLSASLVGGAVLAACAPKAEPTVPPAAEAPKAQPTEAPKEAEAPTQAPAAAPKEKVPLRVGAWDFAERVWMNNAPLEYAEQHDEVEIEVEVIPYAECFPKCLTGAATGTLPDVFYTTSRWGPYAAYKGAFLFLDDYVAVKDPGMDDWFDMAIVGTKFEDKMFCLPHELHPGRPTAVYYNKDILAEKGLSEPTGEWDWDEFAEVASKITDTSKNLYGTQWLPTNVHDFIAQARSYGGTILSEDRKSCVFESNEGALAAARLQVDLKTKYNAVPGREEREGLQFYAGLYGFYIDSANIIATIRGGVGDTFEWDVCLAPTGPDGHRGGYAFINAMNIASTTKHPQEAYDLAVYMVSADVMKRALLEEGHNPARKSLWRLPEAHHIWGEVADWLDAETVDLSWPAPWNLLFEEMQDTWVNLSPELWYGEVGFDEGVAKLTKEVQTVLSKPRP